MSPELHHRSPSPSPSPSPLPSPSLWQDQFDRIPDSLVLVILDKLADVRSLGRCSVVSKRFRSLVPLVHDVHIKLDSVINFASDEPSTTLCTLNLILSTIFKPFWIASPSAHYSPSQILNNFSHLRHLTIEFPSADTLIVPDGVLKWRAKMDGTLTSFIILVGHQTQPATLHYLRWATRSLHEGFRRFKFLSQIFKDSLTLRRLVLQDADGEGELIITVEYMKELSGRAGASAFSNIAMSNLELRWASYLKLASGKELQGAAMVTHNLMAGESLVEEFDGPSRAAVKAMLKLPNIF